MWTVVEVLAESVVECVVEGVVERGGGCVGGYGVVERKCVVERVCWRVRGGVVEIDS